MVHESVGDDHGKIRHQLEKMLSEAKAYRKKHHDPGIERCVFNMRSEFHPKDNYEKTRSRRFKPVAETYGLIFKSHQVEAHAPRPLFFAMEAEDGEGEPFEDEMEMEMLHVVEVGRFRRAIEESYDNFLTHGYSPVLSTYDSELDVERPEVLDPDLCWVDPSPLAGTMDERIWRVIERKTTVPDLLREQASADGAKYDKKALDRLKKKRSAKGSSAEEPEEFEVWTWWGDFYLDQGRGEPSKILQQFEAVWTKDELLHFAPIDMPGKRTPLQIWSFGSNTLRDMYGRPVLLRGVPLQSLINAVENQGVDFASTRIKNTPWIRAGSDLHHRGIVFGEPIISERRDDFDMDPTNRGGAGMDLLFNLGPMLIQEYARAIGAPHTHDTTMDARTATAERIQAGATDIRTKSAVWGVGEQIATTLEQLQQMRARRKAQEIAAGKNVAASRRAVDIEVDETGKQKAFADVSTEAWAHKYKAKMVGSGMIADRQARLAGYGVFLETLTVAQTLDPELEGAYKLTDLVKRSFEDNLGYDRGNVIRTEQEMQQLAAQLAAQLPPPVDPATAGQPDPFQGGA